MSPRDSQRDSPGDSQRDLSAFGARGLLSAHERAAEYQRQLDEIVTARLRARFLHEIVDQDLAAKRLMR
jgi:hypothetical protein